MRFPDRRVAAIAMAVAIVAVLGFVVTGPRSLTGPSTPDAAPADLAGQLVTGAALGATWAPAAPPAPGTPLCPVAAASAVPSAERVAAAFTNATGTVMLSHTLRRYEGAASEVVAAIRRDAPRCGEFAVAGTVYRLTQLTEPDLGDEAVAFEVVSDTGMTADMVYVRVGDVVATIAHARSGGPDVATTEAFVITALTAMGVATPATR